MESMELLCDDTLDVLPEVDLLEDDDGTEVAWFDDDGMVQRTARETEN